MVFVGDGYMDKIRFRVVELSDFILVPKDADLCFSVIDAKGERRYYHVSAFDLEPLREVAKLEPYKAPKMLRVFEYFTEKDLRCQEPSIDSCIQPELDPRQKPEKDSSPDTTIEKTPPEREEQFKMDMGL